MKAAKSIVRSALLASSLAGLISCGEDTVAGKTTTTTNGGGMLALGPDGKPLAGCIALAARGWDPVRGIPGSVDTGWSDSTGFISLPQESYLFVEIRDGARFLGSRVSAPRKIDGIRQVVHLDTLRRVSGRWPDRSGIAQGRLFLDSTFHSVGLMDDDAFVFEGVADGAYSLVLEAAPATSRRMGVVRLERGNIRFEGSGNVVLTGDTTGSPLWIDDFEAGTAWPLLQAGLPTVSPWFVWWLGAGLTLPGSGEPDSIPRAIGPDSTRPGRVFTSRFTTTSDPSAQVAVGLTNMQLDLRSRDRVCFAYRSDAPLRIEFQRDSVAGVRPTLSTNLPASFQWRDTCASTATFLPNSDTPDSLANWSAFAKRVLVIQFSVGTGSSFLGLDDIRMR